MHHPTIPNVFFLQDFNPYRDCQDIHPFAIFIFAVMYALMTMMINGELEFSQDDPTASRILVPITRKNREREITRVPEISVDDKVNGEALISDPPIDSLCYRQITKKKKRGGEEGRTRFKAQRKG